MAALCLVLALAGLAALAAMASLAGLAGLAASGLALALGLGSGVRWGGRAARACGGR